MGFSALSFDLVIVNWINSDAICQALADFLAKQSYRVYWSSSATEFYHWIEDQRQQIDCLILDDRFQSMEALQYLADEGVLLPAIVISAADPETVWDTDIYHRAVVQITLAEVEQLEQHINQAIKQFLALPSSQSDTTPSLNSAYNMQLRSQQQRLTDKLKERLGYLGVYYKRNSDQFLRNMSQSEQEELIEQLKRDYRAIILKYFSNQSDLNSRIDDFVNIAFFADVSVSQIVEIHMDLMDEFSKQLKLEGRSEEILLDYRLTLIDVIAHLCEMYRRSIPREP